MPKLPALLAGCVIDLPYDKRELQVGHASQPETLTSFQLLPFLVSVAVCPDRVLL